VLSAQSHFLASGRADPPRKRIRPNAERERSGKRSVGGVAEKPRRQSLLGGLVAYALQLTRALYTAEESVPPLAAPRPQ